VGTISRDLPWIKDWTDVVTDRRAWRGIINVENTQNYNTDGMEVTAVITHDEDIRQ
jgi:hypothetical protein